MAKYFLGANYNEILKLGISIYPIIFLKIVQFNFFLISTDAARREESVEPVYASVRGLGRSLCP